MRRSFALIVPALLAACAMSEPTLPKVVVFFGHASTALDSAAVSNVSIAAREANGSPGALVTVAGYAANNGNPDADAQLAAARAQLVARQLQADGVQASRIQVIPRPPSNEDAAVGARRVEISIGDAAGG
jgi:outer membrane protein OmpA-like peptidoglycan-associated protein